MFQIGEFAKSLEIFDEVLVLDPENEIALDFRRRSTIETLSKESIMTEETHKQYLIGMDYYQSGNLDEAILIWEEILMQEPYNKKVLKAVQGANDKKTQGEN